MVFARSRDGRAGDGRAGDGRAGDGRAAGPALLAIGAVLLVWAIAGAAWYRMHATPVAVAAAFDVFVTAGAAMYWLGVRRARLPRWALGITLAAGGIAAKCILYTVDNMHFGLVATATLELGAVAMIAIRMRPARRAWRAARAAGGAVHGSLVDALAATGLPARAAEVIATELAISTFAVAGWRRPRSGAFTMHRASGWSLVAGVFVVLTLIETPVAHVLLVVAHLPTVAWIASALSVYSALWLVGDAHALRHGGARLVDNASANGAGGALAIDLGVRWRAWIAYRDITSVAAADGPAALDLAFAGATSTVVLTFAAPITVRGLFGRTRTVGTLALPIDEPAAFIAALSARIAP